jgi:hypothetical protein
MTDLEKRQEEFATGFGLTLEQYKFLVSSLNYTELITCLELLKAKRHKSQWRERKANAVRVWIDGRITLKPLSITEFRMAEPKWPLHYRLPS